MAKNHMKQKVIVFEGVFERLFRIILQEGGNQGGVIVLEAVVMVLLIRLLKSRVTDLSTKLEEERNKLMELNLQLEQDQQSTLSLNQVNLKVKLSEINFVLLNAKGWTVPDCHDRNENMKQYGGQLTELVYILTVSFHCSCFGMLTSWNHHYCWLLLHDIVCSD